MSMRAVSDAGSARHWRSGQGPIWLLAIGQTAGYGTLYYFFAALLPSLETGFGWSKTLLSLGPTLSIVISALSAPLAGRLIDRGYGGGLLIWGAALGACALAALSLVEGLGTYLVVWAVLGLAWGGLGVCRGASLHHRACQLAGGAHFASTRGCTCAKRTTP